MGTYTRVARQLPNQEILPERLRPGNPHAARHASRIDCDSEAISFEKERALARKTSRIVLCASPMATLTRRAFLALAALLAPLARGRAGAPQTLISNTQPAAISVEDFLRLSQRLVGRATLDARVGATYLNALLTVPTNTSLLAHLATDPPSPTAASPAHADLERTIIEWWYTGTYVIRGERRLATHAGALMWNALDVPAPGTHVRRAVRRVVAPTRGEGRMTTWSGRQLLPTNTIDEAASWK
jgi:hypothetical protein